MNIKLLSALIEPSVLVLKKCFDTGKIVIKVTHGIIKPIKYDTQQLLHKWIEWIETGWVGGEFR